MVETVSDRQNAVGSPAANEPDGWQRASQSVFRVEGPGMRGTSFKTDNDTYVTNTHVVAGTHQMFLRDQDGQLHRVGRDVWYDPSHDVAAFTAGEPRKMPQAPSLPFAAPDSLTAGTSLHQQGFPGGYDAFVPKDTPAHLTGFRRSGEIWASALRYLGQPENARFVEEVMSGSRQNASDEAKRGYSRQVLIADRDSGKGTSGGPWLTDSGEVAAVNFGAFRGEGLSTPAADVQNFLTQRDKFAHVAGEYRSNLELLADETRTRPLSAAWIAGINAFEVGTGAMAFQRNSLPWRVAGGALGALALMSDGYYNAQKFSNIADTRDKVKFGTAFLGDATMLGGLALSMMPGSIKLAARIAMAGLATRVGSEAIRNNLMIDVPAVSHY